MNMVKRLRPSPAMAVALIALVVAMGGTAVAGKQVKESTLAAVPKATNLTTAESGQTMSGVFSGGAGGGAIGVDNGYIGVGITYPKPLATAIDAAHIRDIQDDNYTAKCPGEGKAAKGFLCLYNTIVNGVDLGYGYSDKGYTTVNGKSVGAILYWYVNDNEEPYVGGTWTLKAP